ncbi:MAG: ArdC family protein [Phycisphaerales bacterium]
MTKAQEARKTIDESLERLSEELTAGKSETLTAFLAMAGKFHRYSFGNIMLIMSQRPDAVRVAGYRTWQGLGRQVRKGEKSITIIAPMMLKKDTKAGEDPEKVLRFKATSVFDVSQTDGDELPMPAKVQGTPGEHLDRLKAHIASLGIRLDFSEESGGASGMSMGGIIVIRTGLGEAETFSVLVHELAHEMLHHGENAERGDKPTRELEAEAVAHAVCCGIGLEPGSACSDYIQSYGGDAEKLGAVLHRVQRTASVILEAVLIPADDTAQAEQTAAVVNG